MTKLIDTQNPPDDVIPLDEAAAAQNHTFIDQLLNAKQVGPVMTLNDIDAWLAKTFGATSV